jgi:23S rRNA (uracil1939-C5)-methyltransferase
MNLPPNTEYVIENLSHDGQGVARRDGKVCFVKGALPGETVKAHVTQKKSSHDNAELVSVEIASNDRVTPNCPLVNQCGGCQLQHLKHTAQVNYKDANLLDMFARMAGIEPENHLPPFVSDAMAYRSRARLSVYTPNKGRPIVGFREENNHQIVTIEQCPVLHPLLQSLPAHLNSLLAKLQKPKLIGHIELAVIENKGQTKPLIHLRSTEYLCPEDFQLLSALARDCDCKISLQFGEKGYEDITDNADNSIALTDRGLNIHYRGGDFMQANPAVNNAMVKQIIEWLAPVQGKILDAFCGLGNFSLALAQQGHDVVGVEVSADMVKRAKENAQINDLNVEFICRDLMSDNKQLARKDFAAMVLDPPRDGAKALIEEMLKKKIPMIAYVSCNPATLARDAALLAKAGYKLHSACLADMFPQTSHMEALALFTHSGKKKN